MYTAIEDRNTQIEVARQSSDPDVRGTVKGVRVVGPATMQRIRATLRTPAQAGDFLDYADEHDPALAGLHTLVLHRGLRRGEAAGLPDTARLPTRCIGQHHRTGRGAGRGDPVAW